MARGNKSQRCDKPTIKYRCGPLDTVSFDLVGFDIKDYVSTSNKKKKKDCGTRGVRSSDILSTKELISAIGSIWDHAICPLSVLLAKSGCRYDNGYSSKQNILNYSTKARSFSERASGDKQIHLVNLTSSSDLLSLGHLNLKHPKILDKILFTEPPPGSYSLLRRFLHENPTMPLACLKEKDPSRVGIPFDLEKMYFWMREIALANPECQMNFTAIRKHENKCSISDPSSCIVSADKICDADNLVAGSSSSKSENTKLSVSSLGQNQTRDTDIKVSAAIIEDIKACTSQVQMSKPCTDSAVNILSSSNGDFEGSKTSNKPDVLEKKNDQKESIDDDNSEVGVFLPLKEKSCYVLAKQKHAFAGAMAGISVSMCLHPVDTVKTVIQSSQTNPKSLLDISRSIISERGITGLYRGISTNIASSAPISAIYTFTYESVKGTILPFFPKEYQSLAHCLAGGCASVATSFIFTPSERIKQQMQVGSRYLNCWNALLGIIEKGGLSSLYAGWGAVLCRNIPHSIIKFYTYESLKQLLSSVQLNGQTCTFVTLVSGGLAGSTAALFTTPFDVVKTKLQTQNPGSVRRYHGVLDVLKDITKSEGLKGLFRGLTPRLFMYMTQGALFFASYESFKKLLSLSLEVPEEKVQGVPFKNTRKDRPSYYLDQHQDLLFVLVN